MEQASRNVGRECQKCGKVRGEQDGPPHTECAFCGTNYEEFEAALARLRKPVVAASAPAPAPPALEPPPWRPADKIEIPGLAAASYLRGIAVLMLVLLGITAAGMLIAAMTPGERGGGLAWGWIVVVFGAALVTPCVLIGFASIVTNIAEMRRLLHERLKDQR